MIEIDKIKIKVNGTELELTLDECKQLRNILDNFLNDKPSITTKPIEQDMDYWKNLLKPPCRINDYPFPQPVINWCDTRTNGTHDLGISSIYYTTN